MKYSTSSSRPRCSITPDNHDSIEQTIEQVVENYICDTTRRSDDEQDYDTDNAQVTSNPETGLNLKQFSFTEPNPGINVQIYGDYYNKSPIDFYELFVDKNILSMMVIETNRYATQCKAKENASKARIHNWQETNIDEKNFLV